MHELKVGEFPDSGMLYIYPGIDGELACQSQIAVSIKYLQKYKDKYPGALVITAHENVPVYQRKL